MDTCSRTSLLTIRFLNMLPLRILFLFMKEKLIVKEMPSDHLLSVFSSEDG